MGKVSAPEPTRTRAFHIVDKIIDEEKRTVRVAFSSEKPVLVTDRNNRSFYEILDHGEGVDLSRMRSGAPVLKDHNQNDQRGVVDDCSIDSAERVGRATLRFSKSVRGQEEFEDVKDGIRTKISFGYTLGKGERDPANDKDGIPAMRFRSWMPYEISTVSVPEDDSVGVGRSYGGIGIPADEPDSENKPPEGANQQRQMVTENATVPAEPKAPEVDVEKLTENIRKAELDRTNSIRAFANRVSIAESEVNKAIESGVEFDTFTRSFTQGAIATVQVSDGPKAPLADLEIGLNAKDRSRFSVVKALRELGNPRGGLTGLEKEVTDECIRAFKLDAGENALHIPTDILIGSRTRDLEAGVSAEGGYTVATDLGGMIDLLRNRSMVMQLGATQLTGLKGNLQLPRLDGAATASWVDEEGSVSETAQTFGQLSLTPNRLAARTAFSDQLLAQSSVSVENVVRADLMKVTAIELDRASLHGSGASNQPLGLDGTSGIGSVTFGGAPTWADVVEFETDVSAANGMIGNASFLTSAAVRGKWKTTVKVASTDSRFLCENNEANGYPLYVSENVTGNIVFFGVWSELIVATWGAMSVIVDPYSKAQTGQRVITVCSFHDVAVRQPAAFSVSADSGAQ